MRFFPLFFSLVHRNCPIFGKCKMNWGRGSILSKFSQNRFWVMKLCFLGKIRGKNFLTQIWDFGSFFYPPRPPGGWGRGVQKILYWSPAFRICTGCLPKYEWNSLKIGFKNTYFQVFSGFPPIPASSQMANFVHFLAKMGKTGFFSKKRLEHFFALTSPN